MLKGLLLSLLMGPVAFAPVPREVIEALTAAQVTVGAGQRSGFQLTFALSKKSLLSRTLLPAGYFDPMIRVILIATINGTPNVLIDGVITRQQVTPSNEPGQSTLTVTGEDLTQVMDLIDFSGFPFPCLPPEARVALMVAKYAVFGIVPLVLPSVLIDIPLPTDIIPTQKGTDLAYINELANAVGYVFYIDPGPVPGTNIAYWGPEIKVGVPQPALNVNMDALTNVDSLGFTYDGLGKKLFLLTILEPITKVPIPIPVPDITPLNPPLGAKPPLPLHVERIKDEGIAKLNPLRAAAIAIAKASQASDVITGTGSLDVLRYGRVLKARQLVGVRGAGLAYDGLYYVRSVTHDIKRGEYKQNFTLSRNGLISTVPGVVP